MKDATVAKTQVSKSGSAQKKAPAAAQSDAKGARLNVDTTGMTPEQIAALAEDMLPKRKPRNKVSAEPAKGSKKPGKDPANVKSTEKAPEKAQDTAPAKPLGRPSSFTEEVADAICERLSVGEPLRQICRDDNMPAWRTVYAWMEANEKFRARIARAREMGEEALGQECLDIADNATNDWMEKFNQDGDSIGWQLNGDHVQRSKLRIETRLKLLAKWNPKKWGDKVDLNHGGQPGNPVEVKTKVVVVPQKQAAEVETRPLEKEQG